MGYNFPGHHPQGYNPQSMHQYTAHGQGMMYPMPMTPYGHNSGGMPYGMSYPAYPPYAIPQHPGPQPQHHYPPHGTQMQNMPNLNPGQVSPYSSGYYPHSSYGPYGHGVPAGQMPQAISPVRTNTSSPSKPVTLRKEADKRMTDLEYDVSKTIVDGSNPKKIAQSQPQPPFSSELLSNPLTLQLLLTCIHLKTILPLRNHSRPLRVPHEDHPESPSNLATRCGLEIFLPEPVSLISKITSRKMQKTTLRACS